MGDISSKNQNKRGLITWSLFSPPPLTASTSPLPQWLTPGDRSWSSLLWHNETKCLDRGKLWTLRKARRGEGETGKERWCQALTFTWGVEVLKWGRCYNILCICWKCFLFSFFSPSNTSGSEKRRSRTANRTDLTPCFRAFFSWGVMPAGIQKRVQ